MLHFPYFFENIMERANAPFSITLFQRRQRAFNIMEKRVKILTFFLPDVHATLRNSIKTLKSKAFTIELVKQPRVSFYSLLCRTTTRSNIQETLYRYGSG